MTAPVRTWIEWVVEAMLSARGAADHFDLPLDVRVALTVQVGADVATEVLAGIEDPRELTAGQLRERLEAIEQARRDTARLQHVLRLWYAWSDDGPTDEVSAEDLLQQLRQRTREVLPGLPADGDE